MTSMRWASASSQQTSAEEAATEIARALALRLGPPPADLLLAFVSGTARPRTEAIAEKLRALHPATTFAAVSARGVVTESHEIESGVAVSVVAARLPGVEVKPFLLLRETWTDPVT